MRARFGPALKFSEHDEPMIQVMNYAWLETVEADEAKAAHDLVGRKDARNAAELENRPADCGCRRRCAGPFRNRSGAGNAARVRHEPAWRRNNSRRPRT